MAGKNFTFAFQIAASLNKNFGKAFAGANEKISALSKKYDTYKDYEKIFKGVNDAFSQGVINANSYNNALSKIPAVYRKMYENSDAIEKMGKAFGKSQLIRMAGKSGISWAKNTSMELLALSKDARDFEESMADVRKVVDFDSPEQFKSMSREILNMSTRIPMTAEGLAQIVAAGGQSGIARKDLTAFAESAAKMGIAFDITADQAGEMMAKWRTAFKMNQDDVVKLADKINYLGNTTAASAPQISDVVTRIGPLGAVGGLAADEIAAMGASLVGSGIQSEVAATGLKNFILTMTSGESATKKQHEAFMSLGLDAEEMARKMQTDAKDAIIEVLSAINSIDKVQQSAVLKDLFGEKAIGAIAPLLTNIDNLKKNFEGVADSSKYAGSMQKEFEERSKTTASSLQLLESNAKALKISFGDALLPTIQAVAGGMGTFAQWITKCANEHPAIANTFATLAVGGVGLVGTLSALAYVGSTLSFAFKTGSTALDLMRKSTTMYEGVAKITTTATKIWTLAQGVFNTVLAACPIGWLLFAIAALVVGGTILYRNWDKVKQFFTELWNNPTARLLMFVTGPIGWLIAAVSSIIANWDTIKSYFEYFWDNPSAAIFRFQNYLKEQIQGAVDWVFQKWGELKVFLSNPISGSVLIAKKAMGIGTNAAGGIYSKGAFLTTFAENSGESAIPHTPTSRNIGLLARTNEIMGNPLGGGINATFSPVINISGGADIGQVNDLMESKMHEFEAMLRRVAEQQRRVSYG